MGNILLAEEDGVYVLKFVGDVRLTLGPTIASFLEKLKNRKQFKSMIIDLSDTDNIDSTALGLIAKIAICTREQFDCVTSVVSPNEDITRILSSMAMEQVCVVCQDLITSEADLSELPTEIASEEVLREQVLDAHKTLMAFNDQNYDKFSDLVAALENEKSGEPARATGTC